MGQVTFLDRLWEPIKDGNPAALAIYRRHYSRRSRGDWGKYRDGYEAPLFVGPGEKLVLLAGDGKALFAWRKFIDDSGQKGVNCAIFRNEGPVLSSTLILEAEGWAWWRWPGERLYTYINPGKIRKKRDPGRCFLRAGWSDTGVRTSRGLVVLEKLSP